MFKKIMLLAIVTVIAGILAGGSLWADCGCVCDVDPDQCQSRVTTRVQAGKMHMKEKWTRIYLYEKDPLTWDVIGKGGAWGFLDYRPQGTDFKFLFVARLLEPSQQYSLIYYPDPWPGAGLICLGSGTTDVDGKLKIVGKGDPTSPFYSEPVSTGDLPADYDANADFGAKIWLVLSSDVDCINQEMIGWNPTQYLFETTLITFVDTDD